MAEPRKHPDIFTPEEAMEYLHLDPAEGERILESWRDSKGLVGFRVGRRFMYHREDLDACVTRVFGRVGSQGRGPHLKIGAR